MQKKILKELRIHLENEGIVHQSLCVDTYQQDQIAKKKNIHFLEVILSLMFTNQVPKFLWGETVLTVTNFVNKISPQVLSFKYLTK